MNINLNNLSKAELLKVARDFYGFQGSNKTSKNDIIKYLEDQLGLHTFAFGDPSPEIPRYSVRVARIMKSKGLL